MAWRRYALYVFYLMVIAVVTLSGCQPTTRYNANQTSANNSPVSSPLSSSPNSQSALVVGLPSFYNLIDLVEHSVVAINTETVMNSGNVQSTAIGAGSGWIVDESGIIVTNYHVVAGANLISIVLRDGTVYTPTKVKSDAAADIAILMIDAGRLPALKAANPSTIRIGDWVVAVGNPLGMGISAKNGIVGRLGVNVQVSSNESYSNLIETNAAINPGNSGGPLVNLSGEVVGITSLKLSAYCSEGMGFAINIEDALPVIRRLSR